MAKPKFYLEPRPGSEQAINMFYSFNGLRLQYYTGIRIEKKYYRNECINSDTINPIKSTAPFSVAYNTKLKGMAAKVVSIVSDTKGADLTVEYVRKQLDLTYKPKHTSTPLEKVNEPPTKITFLTFFSQIIIDRETGKAVIAKGKRAGKHYTLNSIKNIRTSLAAVKRFLNYKGKPNLLLEDVNKQFYDDFKFFCFGVEKKELSSFGNFIKDIKTVMKASKTPVYDPDVFLKPSYESDTIYLNSDQIDQIASLDFSDVTKHVVTDKGSNVYYPTLNKVRDLFLIGCYTGLRYGNFSKLDFKSIDENFIQLKQVKTEGRVVIPVMSKLRPVLGKYPTALPTISNQKFNEYIKLIAKEAGLTQLYSIKNTKGNLETIKEFPLYTLISSHCCRRSYSTNMFNAGVPILLITSTTGHSTESSFLKYIRATNQDKAKMFASIMIEKGTLIKVMDMTHDSIDALTPDRRCLDAAPIEIYRAFKTNHLFLLKDHINKDGLGGYNTRFLSFTTGLLETIVSLPTMQFVGDILEKRNKYYKDTENLINTNDVQEYFLEYHKGFVEGYNTFTNFIKDKIGIFSDVNSIASAIFSFIKPTLNGYRGMPFEIEFNSKTGDVTNFMILNKTGLFEYGKEFEKNIKHGVAFWKTLKISSIF